MGERKRCNDDAAGFVKVVSFTSPRDNLGTMINVSWCLWE